MKKFSCLALFALLSTLAISQRPFFVYLESGSPFFVKLADRTYSSGAANYIILPQLGDSTYLVRVGFPQNRYPDQVFRLSMNGRDRGFVLQELSGSWGLVDQQGAGTIAAEKTISAFRAEPRTVSRFTDILSRATDDPSLRFTMIRIQPDPPIVKAVEQPVRDSVTPVAPLPESQTTKPVIADDEAAPHTAVRGKTDTVASRLPETKTDSVVASRLPEAKTDPVLAGRLPEIKTNSIVASPLPETKTNVKEPRLPGDSGASTPVTSGAPQPVAGTQALAPPAVPVTAVREPVKADTDTNSSSGPVSSPGESAFSPARVTKKGESSTTLGFGLTFIDEYEGHRDTVRILIPPSTLPVALTTSSAPASEAPLPVNCRNVTTDADVLKARKKMQQATDEKSMLAEGDKLLRSKCISTEQLRGLARIFPGDGGRFKLYAQSYSRVADPVNFPKLQSELNDEYFIDRFRALLR